MERFSGLTSCCTGFVWVPLQRSVHAEELAEVQRVLKEGAAKEILFLIPFNQNPRGT